MATLKLTSPLTATISGSTGSGKTRWLYKLLQHKNEMFDIPVHKIIYCYGVWQPLFDEMEKYLDINFHEGVPTIGTINEFVDGQHNIIVLDDLQDQVSNSLEAEQLFTRDSHHKNLTVIYIVQNLYQQGKCARNIALNSHYFIVFKNSRDVTQISNLGRQIGMAKLLQEAYKDATSEAYNLLIVDLSLHTNEAYKLRSHIFPDQDPIIYQ